MNLAITLPDDIARQLEAAWRDMPRKALEALAVEGYRTHALSQRQVGQLLALDFWQTEAFLRERNVWLDYSEADLANDTTTTLRLSE